MLMRALWGLAAEGSAPFILYHILFVQLTHPHVVSQVGFSREAMSWANAAPLYYMTYRRSQVFIYVKNFLTTTMEFFENRIFYLCSSSKELSSLRVCCSVYTRSDYSRKMHLLLEALGEPEHCPCQDSWLFRVRHLLGVYYV